MLVSAYDLQHPGIHKPEAMRARVNQYSDSGGLLMIDSGGYESIWKNDEDWVFDLYQEAIAGAKADFFFGFDAVPGKSESDDAKRYESALKDTISSRKTRASGEFIPILHGSSPKQLLSFLSYFVKKHPDMTKIIAVTERDCGWGLFEKVKTISSARKILDQGNENTILHLLGCGSPSSLALYSHFGVDTFDSLDWLKFTLDERDWVGRDFSYLDVLKCECSACRGSKRDYVERTLLHNLIFYQEFMLRIQSWITNGSLLTILNKRLGFDPEEILK
jgi:queuine/archaeosine tRNA-ribosyltransferase